MLTTADVRNLQPTNTDRVVWDQRSGSGGGQPGFGVRIKPSGAKSYIAVYRTTSGRPRRMTLAKVGQLQLAQARKLAGDYIADARKGLDPAAKRTQERRSQTVGELFDEWIEKAALKDRTRAEYRWLMKADILPELGGLKLRQVTQHHVKRLYAKVASTRAVTANRALAVTSSMLQWAVDQGEIEVNPARGIKRVKKGVEKVDTRALSQAEVGRFLRACETLRAQAKPATDGEPARGEYVARMAICFELMLFAGLRPAESMELRWSQIDWDSGLIHFTEDDQKGGTTKPAYLGSNAIALLKTVAAEKADAVYVFPSRRVKGQPVDDPRKVWEKVETLAKFDRPAKPKHLRKTHLTLGRAMGVPLDLLSQAARHGDESITAKHYVHTGSERVRESQDDLQARLAALVNPPAEVVELRK
jgi:integrase